MNRNYSVNGQNQYTAAGPATFQYDANGNLTWDGSTSFVYDGENRLVSASGGKTASLSYDPLGRLWQVSAPTGTSRFLYNGDDLVLEYDGSGTVTRAYVHGPGTDEPMVVYENGQRRFLHADQQGSIIALSDDWGNPIAVNTYDEYGIPGATNVGRFQYTGQAWIPELGMYYYKARIYSPTLGRFMQTDPIGYKDQINLYAYVGNDPVDGRDPTGTRVDYGNDEDAKRLKLLATDVAGKSPQLAQRLTSLERSNNNIRVRFEPKESRQPGHTRADSIAALKGGKGSGSTVYIPRTSSKIDGLSYTSQDVVASEILGHAFDNNNGNASDNSTTVGNLKNEAKAIKTENIYRGAARDSLRDVPVVPTGFMRSFLCAFGLVC